MKFRPLPPREKLHDLLSYDPESGILTWKYRPGKRRTLNTRFAGKPAGYLSPERGYCTVRIDDMLYSAHRIIWAMVHGDIPEDMQVDHINRTRSDNRLVNLRLATNAQNVCNGPMRSTNKSGFKGVIFHRASGRWNARLTISGKTKSLGYYETPEEAHDAYVSGARLYFGEFARAA